MRPKLLLLFLLVGGWCQLLAQSPSVRPEGPSKQDVVVERLSTRASFENDGKFSRRVEYRARLLSEAAVRQATVVIFPYNNRLEDMQVEFVRVLKADGKKIEAPLGTVEDMSSQIQREAAFYGDFREKHVPVPALAPGDRLEYAYTSSGRRPLVPGHFGMEHNFLSTSIVLSEELVIDVPAARALKIKWAEGLKPEVREVNSRREYRVTHSQPNAEPEGKSDDVPPTVRLSTFQSWDEVGRWFAGAMKDAGTITPEIKVWVAELAPPNKGERARAEVLYSFVATKIRTIGLPFGSRPPEPTATAEVLKNGYGDIIDKCGLLSAMLTAAGFSSSLELLRTTAHFDADVPSLTQFDYVVTKVLIGGNAVWLETASQVAPFGHLAAELRGKNGLEVLPGGDAHLLSTPSDSPVDNSADTNIHGSIDAFGTVSAKVVRTFRGDAEMPARQAFRLTPAKDWPKLVEQIDSTTGLAGEVSDLSVSDPLDVQAPFRVAYSLSQTGFVAWAASQRLVPPASHVGMIRAFAPEQRTTPIPLTKLEVSLEVELTLPAGVTARSPVPIDLHRDFADYSSKYSVEGSTIKIHRMLKVAAMNLPRARYAEHNDFLDTLTKEQGQAFAISGHPAPSVLDRMAKLPVMPLEPELGKQSPLFNEALRAEQYGEVRKAEQGFKQVLAEDPKNAAAWYELGQVYSLMRQRESAINAWKKSAEIDPFQQLALKQLAMTTWQLGRYAEAEAAVRKLLDITPLDPGIRMNLGELLALQGKPKEGIPYLETAVSQDSKNNWARAELAHAYLQAGDTEKGIAALQDLVRDFPAPGMYNAAAHMLADAGVRLDAAEQYATDGLRTVYPLLEGRAEGQPDRMQTSARQLVGFLWDSLGWVYFKRGELAKASEYLKAAWLFTENGEIGGHYAELLVKQGSTTQAARVLGQSLASSGEVVTPSSATSRALLEKLVGKVRAKQLINSGSSELQEMRTIRLGQRKGLNGTAEWNVIFEAGQKPRLEFLTGSHDLDVLKPAAQAANYGFELPSDMKTPFAIRGILSCSLFSGCMMVLTTPAGIPPPGIMLQGLTFATR